MTFWLIVYFVLRTTGASTVTFSQSVVLALSSAMGASLMYGCAVFIAFNRRADQIEKKAWREASPKFLIPIAIRCGLVTWVVIMATTVLWQIPQTWQSLVGLVHLVGSVVGGDAANRPTAAEWNFLPTRLVTALPWLLAGATVSVILAWSVSGDVRRTDKSQRIRDAVILAIGLGLAFGPLALSYAIGAWGWNWAFTWCAVIPVIVSGLTFLFLEPVRREVT
jgi:MFS family permease